MGTTNAREVKKLHLSTIKTYMLYLKNGTR